MKIYRFFILILFLVFGFTGNVSAQQDTVITQKTVSNIENFMQIELLNAKVVDTENILQNKQRYIYMLVALIVLVLVVAGFAVVTFYGKAKKTIQICEIQNNEIKLQNSRIEELSLIINNIFGSVLIASPEGKIEYINEYFKNATGFDLDALKEKQLDNLVPENASEQEINSFKECLEKKISSKYKSSIKDKDGRILHFERRLFTIYSSEKKLLHLVANDYNYTWA